MGRVACERETAELSAKQIWNISCNLRQSLMQTAKTAHCGTVQGPLNLLKMLAYKTALFSSLDRFQRWYLHWHRTGPLTFNTMGIQTIEQGCSILYIIQFQLLSHTRPENKIDCFKKSNMTGTIFSKTSMEQWHTKIGTCFTHSLFRTVTHLQIIQS